MNPYIQVLRYANRIIGLIIGIFLAVMIAGDPIQPNSEETGALILFPGGVILGFLISWKYERAGGLTSLFSLGLFYGYMYISRGGFPGGPYFFLLTLPAVFFVILSFFPRK
jgi:hypothetical protein